MTAARSMSRRRRAKRGAGRKRRIGASDKARRATWGSCPLAVVIGERHVICHAHEERREAVISALPVDRDDGGRRRAVHEAREEREVVIRAERSALKACLCASVMFVVMARLIS